MRRAALLYIAVLVVLAAAGTMAVLRVVGARPPRKAAGAEPVLFAVRTGEPFSSVARRLGETDLVAHPRVLEIYAWVRGSDRRIKAGTYALGGGETPGEILEKLVLGDIFRVSVTIPEGFMHTQIAGALAAAGIDSAVFAGLTNDEEARKTLGVAAPSLEGYLFPDTYLIPVGMTPMEAAAMMRARLDEVFEEKMARRAEELSMTRHQVLTLASIIQAEARLSGEMPLVSAVYHNRLRNGIRLEADPTVAYAMGGYKGRLYYKDLEIESPYNTYEHAGLPPGPICAPGKASIEAALYPDTTCRAVYFVAKGDGGHIFSLTLEEHLAAVESVKRSRNASD
jgi:UPF0755 protein